MKPGLTPGRSAELTIRVTREMCPHFDGVLVHPVYATWTLVHHFELTGRRLLAPHLEAEQEAVGAHISVDHKSPAPIGSTVTIRAEIESFENNRLVCRMSASCGPRLLATGSFVQVILSKQRLRSLIERYQPEALE